MPDPAVGLDAVLIRSVATGVNPMDWKVRSGTRQKHFPLTMPAIPGKDVSGVGCVDGSACRAAVHTARKRGTTIIVGVRARQSAEVESLGAPDGVANTAAGGGVAGVLSPRQ